MTYRTSGLSIPMPKATVATMIGSGPRECFLILLAGLILHARVMGRAEYPAPLSAPQNQVHLFAVMQ
ncbi:MAG: hypothetical protein R3B91_20790 [Planctomycetaceae bacterium]